MRTIQALFSSRNSCMAIRSERLVRNGSVELRHRVSLQPQQEPQNDGYSEIETYFLILYRMDCGTNFPINNSRESNNVIDHLEDWKRSDWNIHEGWLMDFSFSVVFSLNEEEAGKKAEPKNKWPRPFSCIKKIAFEWFPSIDFLHLFWKFRPGQDAMIK